MNDRFQPRTRIGVGEDDPAEGGSVEAAVRSDNTGPEGRHHRVEPCRPRLDHLTREQVGVDDHRAARGEARGDSGLSRPDAARQRNAPHGNTSGSDDGEAPTRPVPRLGAVARGRAG